MSSAGSSTDSNISKARSDLPWLVALSTLEGLGAATLRPIISSGCGEEAWNQITSGMAPSGLDIAANKLSHWSHQARDVNVNEVYELHVENGVVITTFGDNLHPGGEYPDPFVPPMLFWSSSPAPFDLKGSVAIVGTRKTTRYGSDISFELGAALIAANLNVVSGLALGVDAHAHRGAVSACAETSSNSVPVAVIGCGIDIVYPKRNSQIYRRVVEEGLIVSEYPMGTKPAAWRFPARNRIIVGLSRAVVVVESHISGGSLITANYAAQRGIEVLAVPGSIRSPASAGTNRLIADGAIPAISVDDVLVAVGFERAPTLAFGESDAVEEIQLTGVSGAGRIVIDELGWEPVSIDRLLERCPISPAEFSSALVELVAAKLIQLDAGVAQRIHTHKATSIVADGA